MGRGHRSQSIKWIRCSQMPQDLTPTMKRGANRPFDPDFSPYTPARPLAQHKHITANRILMHSVILNTAYSNPSRSIISHRSVRPTQHKIKEGSFPEPLWARCDTHLNVQTHSTLMRKETETAYRQRRGLCTSFQDDTVSYTGINRQFRHRRFTNTYRNL